MFDNDWVDNLFRAIIIFMVIAVIGAITVWELVKYLWVTYA